MPRVNLSQAEKDLIERWKIAAWHHTPCLSGVVIEGNDGIRGIRNLTVNFDRPITVICGKNGCGKSTVVSLSRLGFQQDHQFDDLFIEINNPHPFNDFSVRWSYLRNDPPEIRLDGGTRTYSAPPPAKNIVYLGLSRVVPAWEKPSLVTHFRENRAWDQQKQLEARNVDRLRDILNKPFTGASWGLSGEYELHTCSTHATYTSFNMCTGEEMLVEMIRLLQEAEPESLILIEDAEIGLNPVIMPRFARHLVEICLDKRLQIILTTHSLDLITAFPAELVCLIKSDGVSQQAKDNPEMQEIFTSISTQVESDVIIFCEDDVAESLIRQAVPGDLRRRLKVVYGSKTKLLGYAEAHLKAGWPQIPIIVWDGDVTSAEVNEWLRKLDKPTSDELNAKVSLLRLPGEEPPERWILSQLLNTESGCQLLAEELNDDEQTTRAFLGMLSTMAAFHSISFELAQKTGLDEKAVLRSLTRSIGRLPTDPLAILREQIGKAANKEIIQAV
jgi:predicted ATPase